MAITCTYPVSPYPPPPPPAFPIGAGDGCLVASYHCVCTAGVPAWVNDTASCISNSACTGAATCDASVYSIEMLGGCSGGVPNVPVTPPPQGTPPCDPTCCAPTGCCTRSKSKCVCYNGVPSWVVEANGLCVPNTQCNPANDVSTGQNYQKEVLNSCICGHSTGTADFSGRIAADCCSVCTYVFTAQCFNNGQGWQVSAPDPTACAPCVATGWTPAGSCTQTQRVCGNSCSTANGIADCQTDAAIMAAPLPTTPTPTGALPACCQNLNGNGGCGAAWRSTCTGGAWQTPVLQPTGIAGGINPVCVDNCADYEYDWAGSGCTRTKVACTGTTCLPGGPCSASPPAVPSSIPGCCAGASPCLGGSACQTTPQNAAAVSVPGVSPGDPWCIGLASTPFPATVPFNVHTGSTWQWHYTSGVRDITINVSCSGGNVTANITIGGVSTNVTWSSFPGFVNTLSCVGGHITGSVTLPLVGSPGQTMGGIKGTGNPCAAADIAAPSTVTLTFA